MKLSNRFTLLASGLIGLSALAASPAAAQNASVCRSSVGVIGDFAQRCLTRPDGTLGGLINNAVGTVNATHDQLGAAAIENQYKTNEFRQQNSALKTYQGILNDGLIGDGRAAAVESRQTTTRNAPASSGSSMAPARTAVVNPTYSTTTTKTATGQTIVTNDHRNPAGAAPKPNSPTPTAAIGSTKNTASAQSTQTSMDRDHRHK